MVATALEAKGFGTDQFVPSAAVVQLSDGALSLSYMRATCVRLRQSSPRSTSSTLLSTKYMYPDVGMRTHSTPHPPNTARFYVRTMLMHVCMYPGAFKARMRSAKRKPYTIAALVKVLEKL